MNAKVKQVINDAPKAPGVYFFYAKNQLLYIGKANDLRTRLRNYLKPTDHKSHLLDKEANRLKLVKLSSPIEALIEEARFIKNLKPRLNVYWSDDKQYFYVAFTKEEFPRIFLSHQQNKNNQYIGPFTDGKALKLALKILRKHLPYCSCKKSHLRECLNSQIGLCPGYCCQKNITFPHGRVERSKEYQNNTQAIKDILSGKRKSILKKIIKPTDAWAFENLDHHQPFINSKLKKIECYDISNMAGKEAVGALTVLVNTGDEWRPDKNQFRKFKIRSKSTRDDPRMIEEILTRRLNHPEWPYPDLIVIDGGITQYNAAKRALGNNKINLISFAKPNQKIYGKSPINKDVVQRIIQQTHNFVVKYHQYHRDRIKI